MHKKWTTAALVSIGTAVAAPTAMAHEGHGNPAWWGQALHYLLEPVHAVGGLLLLASTAVLIVYRRRARRNAMEHR